MRALHDAGRSTQPSDGVLFLGGLRHSHSGPWWTRAEYDQVAQNWIIYMQQPARTPLLSAAQSRQALSARRQHRAEVHPAWGTDQVSPKGAMDLRGEVEADGGPTRRAEHSGGGYAASATRSGTWTGTWCVGEGCTPTRQIRQGQPGPPASQSRLPNLSRSPMRRTTRSVTASRARTHSTLPGGRVQQTGRFNAVPDTVLTGTPSRVHLRGGQPAELAARRQGTPRPVLRREECGQACLPTVLSGEYPGRLRQPNLIHHSPLPK